MNLLLIISFSLCCTYFRDVKQLKILQVLTLGQSKLDSPEVSEWHLELQLLLRQRLHLLDEVLEGRLELVPHLPLHLLGVQVVAVVHVLVFAQVGGDLPDLRVELDVRVAPLAEHDGVLEGKRDAHEKCLRLLLDGWQTRLMTLDVSGGADE